MIRGQYALIPTPPPTHSPEPKASPKLDHRFKWLNLCVNLIILNLHFTFPLNTTSSFYQQHNKIGLQRMLNYSQVKKLLRHTLFPIFPWPLYRSKLLRILVSSFIVSFRTTVADSKASSSNWRVSTSSNPMPSCSLLLRTRKNIKFSSQLQLILDQSFKVLLFACQRKMHKIEKLIPSYVGDFWKGPSTNYVDTFQEILTPPPPPT